MSRARLVRVHGGVHYGIAFTCPGCSSVPGGDPVHHIPTPPHEGAWTFNGDMERPTLFPSILVHPHGTYAEDGKTVVQSPRCHSFVTDGRIQFLSDSSHALAGQAVDLPEIA